ncbi:MAG: 2-phospho-L-lactate guanylyltransferase [Anaerolineales bacterium]|nr:2-phospho-L-lactate guanylyltransferase [Anaerolineales bacterium]
MAIWAIVPVKPLRRGKSRLAEVMSVDERAELNEYLLAHTLKEISAVPEIENVLVVSRDPAALSLARDLGARTVQENGNPGLNIALTRAAEIVKSYETCGILVLPADIPGLSREEISKLLSYTNDPPVVVVSPDRSRQGTNALAVCPAGLIEYDFGEGSFEKHCQRAKEAGARLVICELPALALDLDEPEDLKLVEAEFRKEKNH